MGDITNAMIAVANMRQDQQRTNLYAQNTLADNARQAFEFQQRQEQQMLARADALKQYRSERRDRLTGDFVTTLDKTIDAQKTLNTIRAQANAEAVFRGGSLSPLTQKSLQEAEGVFSALSGVSQRIQQQINSDDNSMEMLSLMTGGGEKSGGGDAADPDDGAPGDGGAQQGPETAPMDNSMFMDDIVQELGRRGLSGGMVRNGKVEYHVNSEDEAKFYNDVLKQAGEARKLAIPAVVVNREPALRMASQNYFKHRDDVRQFDTRIASYQAGLKDPSVERMKALFAGAQASKDDEQMNVFLKAMTSSDDERKALLQGAIDAAETSRDEDKELLNAAKAGYEEWNRINGLGPIQEGGAPPPELKVAPAAAPTGGGPPAGMTREQFGAWYVQNVSSAASDLPKLKAAWTQYASGR